MGPCAFRFSSAADKVLLQRRNYYLKYAIRSRQNNMAEGIFRVPFHAHSKLHSWFRFHFLFQVLEKKFFKLRFPFKLWIVSLGNDRLQYFNKSGFGSVTVFRILRKSVTVRLRFGFGFG